MLFIFLIRTKIMVSCLTLIRSQSDYVRILIEKFRAKTPGRVTHHGFVIFLFSVYEVILAVPKERNIVHKRGE